MSDSDVAAVVLVHRPQPEIAIVELNRPERLNAMSVDLVGDLNAALTELGEDNQLRVIVLTGAGRAFCSGLDLKDHGITPGIDGMTVPRIALRAMRHFSQVVLTMRRIPQPIIAAVNGPAYGGGMCLAVAADVRIAAESTVMNATGIVNGLTSAELGVSWLLPRLIGAAHANDLLLTGREITAADAFRMGLVSRVVPDDEIVVEALSMAKDMCRFSVHGLHMTKAILRTNLETASLDAAIETEDRNQLLMGLTDNLPEAIAAFAQDREPVYRDEPRRDIFDGG